MKREIKQTGEAVPKRTFAIVAKNQSQGLAPCVMGSGPGAQ